MKNVAFIPVRGGSKSIPLKNIKLMCGKPLVYWTVKAASECPDIDRVFISTDSDKIKETVNSFGFEKAEVIGRSAETANDTASTESAMLEFAEQYEFENIVLIQATSPLLASKDLQNGFDLIHTGKADSVISVARQKRFLWEDDEGSFAKPVNYDIHNRPRRQEFDGYLMENGACYITSRKALLGTKCRLSGRIKTVEMSEESASEIDEPADWIIIESLLKRKLDKLPKPQIKMFLTDCDGTLTDGGMYYSADGEELKKFNTRDGVGLRLLKENGIITGIITSENSEIVKRRAEKLKLDECLVGVENKLETVNKLCAKYGIDISETAYIGDDINDLEVIKSVGFSACPADANETIKSVVSFVTTARGGGGAVREAGERVRGGSNE
jgi:N-acylneuraminate cytidylyltransferase